MFRLACAKPYNRLVTRRRLRMLLAMGCVAMLSTNAASLADASALAYARADAVLARMTLEQKVGQLFLVTFKGPSLSPSLQRMIAEYHIGGVVLFKISGNVVSARQIAQLVNEAQSLAARSGAGVPLFVAVDEEGGRVSRLPEPAPRFPSAMALGATRSEESARAAARATAEMLRALGINTNFAPVLDVNDNPENPIIGTRAFSDDPQLVGRLGVATMQAYREAGILAVVKHFPGHGGTAADSHLTVPQVKRTAEATQRIDLFPFARAIEAGADAIMTAHVVHVALDATQPATFSPRILRALLRDQLSFRGLVVSDSLLMRGAVNEKRSLSEALVQALMAGADVLAIGADPGYEQLAQPDAYRAVRDAALADPAVMRRVNEAARRILWVKARYGLLDWRPVDPSAAEAALRDPQKHALAQRLAREAVTLIRDPHAVFDQLTQRALLVVMLDTPAETLWQAIRTCRPDAQRSSIQALESHLRERPDALVVGVLAASRPSSEALVRAAALPAERSLIVSPAQPFLARKLPERLAFLTAFDETPYALNALAEALCGKLQPRRQAVLSMLER